MAISFRSASTATTSLSIDTSITGSAPAGTQSSDILIAIIMMRGGTGQTITPPAGWTLIRRTDDSTDRAVASYWALGSVSAFGWSWTAGSHALLHILAIEGADTLSADPVDIDGGQANAASTSVTAPSITTTSANTLLVFAGDQNGSSTFTAPGSMTERTDLSVGIAGVDDVCGTTATQVLGTAGATGTRVATATSSLASVAQLIAVQMLSEGRISQEAAEVLIAVSGAAARVSQLPVEVIVAPTDLHARISQIVVEVVILGQAGYKLALGIN